MVPAKISLYCSSRAESLPPGTAGDAVVDIVSDSVVGAGKICPRLGVIPPERVIGKVSVSSAAVGKVTADSVTVAVKVTGWL
jgi:hypothetical protein